MASGVYDLNKWRRILHNMKPKNLPSMPGGKRPGSKRKAGAGAAQDDSANKKKLSNIVNKILASKTTEDFEGFGGNIMAGSDGEKSDNSDNYNIYG